MIFLLLNRTLFNNILEYDRLGTIPVGASVVNSVVNSVVVSMGASVSLGASVATVRGLRKQLK